MIAHAAALQVVFVSGSAAADGNVEGEPIS